MSSLSPFSETDPWVAALFLLWTLTVLWASKPLRQKLLRTRWGKALVLWVVLMFTYYHVAYGLVAVLTLVMVSGPDTIEGMTSSSSAVPATKRADASVHPTTVRVLDLLHLQDTMYPKASSTMVPSRGK